MLPELELERWQLWTQVLLAKGHQTALAQNFQTLTLTLCFLRADGHIPGHQIIVITTRFETSTARNSESPEERGPGAGEPRKGPEIPVAHPWDTVWKEGSLASVHSTLA